MPVTIVDMLGMLIRRTPIGLMRRALRQVEADQLPFTLHDLEAHHMAGGDVERVIAAAVQARADGLPDDPARLTGADLAGIDPREVVAHRYRHPSFETPDDLRARAQTDPHAARRLGLQLVESVRKLRALDLEAIPRVARATAQAHVDAALRQARADLDDLLPLIEEPHRAALIEELSRGA